MLLAVCVDGANEGWPKLSAVADVAALLANQAGADWAGLLAEAGRLGQRRSLLTGAALAERLLACPLPAPLEEALRCDSPPGAWRNRPPVRWRPAACRGGRLARRALCLANPREWPRAVSLSAAGAVRAGRGRSGGFALPPALDPLYACLRPVRLVWDALRGRSRRLHPPAEAASP